MSFEAVMPPYNASDPSARFLSSSCLDFLLIELVPMAYRVTHEVDAAAAGGLPEATAAGGEGAGNRASTIVSGTVTATAMDEEEERDAVFFRLERLGYRVGQGLVERSVFSFLPFFSLSLILVCWVSRFQGGGVDTWTNANTHPPRFSRDRPRFNDTLDVIKFLCKDLWQLVFRKQVDNLKTNHRVGTSSPSHPPPVPRLTVISRASTS